MAKRYYRHRRKKKIKLRKILIPAAIIVVLAVAAFIIVRSFETTGKMYLASKSNTTELFFYDDYEGRMFRSEDKLARGTLVTNTKRKHTENGRTYVLIKYDDKEYYVNETSLVESKDDIVLETEKWVRTPVTVYQNDEDSRIASFLKKGSHLEILSYSTVNIDGSIDMYEIRCGDVTGWVYGKYLESTEDAAKAVYNEHGEHDIHKDRIYKSKDLYGGDPAKLDWYPVEKPVFDDNPPLTEARTMYLCAKAAKDIDQYIELAKKSGVNSIVLDVKDGALSCPMESIKDIAPISYKNTLITSEEMENAARKIKEAGIYLICRIVVFNDRFFAADHPEECIVSDVSDQLWPSAFSRLCWYYNVELAKECVHRFGCNEIQFDYVRFPESAYNMSTSESTDFRNKYDEGKVEAIQNFLFYATDQLHKEGVYVSADVFGESAYKYVSAYGQYWPAISNVVDVISGMPYTDHFDRTIDMWTEPYETVYDWAEHAAARQSEIPTPAIARTWVTAYDVPLWNPRVDVDANYVITEVQALYDAGLPGGFLTWNGGSDYEKFKEISDAWSHTYKQ